MRSNHLDDGDKHTPNFYFQVIHPDAISSENFAFGRSQQENLKVIMDDILTDGNSNCILPGQMEAEFAIRTEKEAVCSFLRTKSSDLMKLQMNVDTTSGNWINLTKNRNIF